MWPAPRREQQAEHLRVLRARRPRASSWAAAVSAERTPLRCCCSLLPQPALAATRCGRCRPRAATGGRAHVPLQRHRHSRHAGVVKDRRCWGGFRRADGFQAAAVLRLKDTTRGSGRRGCGGGRRVCLTGLGVLVMGERSLAPGLPGGGGRERRRARRHKAWGHTLAAAAVEGAAGPDQDWEGRAGPKRYAMAARSGVLGAHRQRPRRLTELRGEARAAARGAGA